MLLTVYLTTKSRNNYRGESGALVNGVVTFLVFLLGLRVGHRAIALFQSVPGHSVIRAEVAVVGGI